MASTSSDARVAKRRSSGAALKFQVAVVRKKLISPSEYEFCVLLDISHSGVGMASERLEAKVGQKLHMEILHGRKKYAARGIVARIDNQANAGHYGVAFIYAPPELDHIIGVFVNEQPEVPAPKTAEQKTAEIRQRANRLALQNAKVYAKHTRGTDPFVLCHVDNISKTGMGFYSPSKLDKSVPFPVSLRISVPPHAAEVTGTVHHLSKRANGYYYGMEYQVVPMEFVRLLETLET